MKQHQSKLFGEPVFIVGGYEKKPTDSVWFTEQEVSAMKSWTDVQKKNFFTIKKYLGSEASVERQMA